jgi:hypothetical protein
MKDALQFDGARLWSQTQPQHIVIARALRLVLRTQSRSKLSASASLR